MTRVRVEPRLLRWAIARSGVDAARLERRFPRLPQWLQGDVAPTMRQLDAFARATHTPLGYLFLSEPPAEPLPLPDFRTRGLAPRQQPSADLLATIYTMQRRQAWLRELLQEDGVEPVPFVGSASLDDDPEALGRRMRDHVGLDADWAARARTWQHALGQLRQTIEALGVLVVVNGVVGNDTHRRLRVEEFRGFALCDDVAPLIFVNGADARSAQMFTLAHEFAHLWLGPAGEGLSGYDTLLPPDTRVERFCNRAAAEFLVPATVLHAHWPGTGRRDDTFRELARRFKVSPVVVARRALDLGLVSHDDFRRFYVAYTSSERRSSGGREGGDFYATQHARIGRRFAAYVFRAALSGRITFKEAYALTGLHGGTFQAYGRLLGFSLP